MTNTLLTAAISEHVLVQQLDEETVLLDMQSEEYYSLNPSGSCLWKLVTEANEPFGWNEIVQQMATLYDKQNDTEQIEKDMQALLDELVGEGLLKIERYVAV
ncbi:MAG: PqqD family protein [Phormidesmis sp.]